MKLQFKKASVTVSGDCYQIMFHDDRDVEDEDEPYFLIQRQFEFLDGGACHFESHQDDIMDHCEAKSVKLSPNSLVLLFGTQPTQEVEINFHSCEPGIQKFASTLKEMIPHAEIEV